MSEEEYDAYCGDPTCCHGGCCCGMAEWDADDYDYYDPEADCE